MCSSIMFIKLTLKGCILTLHQTSQIISMHDVLTIPAIVNHMIIKILNAMDHPTERKPPTRDTQMVSALPQNGTVSIHFTNPDILTPTKVLFW